MDLNYNILWFEDTDEAFKTLSRRLEKYIDSKNLKCNIDRIKSVTDFDLSKYDLNTYEMLIVDYKLKNNTVGQDIIKTVRNGKYVNDVLFYSSEGYNELEKVLKQYRLEGVFITDRKNEEFLEKIKLLVDKSIRRAESLINIRGIVMDNTSEFDENMKNIVNLSWDMLEKDKKILITTYIKKNLLKNKKDTCEKFINKYSSEDIIEVSELLDEREFTSDMKARLFNKFINLDIDMAKKMREEYIKITDDKECKFKDNYDTNVLWYRNRLAHVKKNTSAAGELFIGTVKDEKICFNSELCSKIRKYLIQYETIFDNIYSIIEMY
ncbi:hypothetical protein FDE82_01945 [Clostridium botulinum]|uniref:hypothetical protein n=1 Tax=Clostridium sporogenes TaxID=1509 RepID=UPI0013CCC5CA|nr:hypothetical protein [Clostridium sporogenes]MCR1972660.1 hypothetical protein [Clostridium sporogenes]NFS20898.1 hypothetical protein [Clostridium botulinum]